MSRNQFQPGNRSGGRPVGARNKLQRDFLEALATDFAEHGPGVIRIARIEKPVEYLKVIASVLPKELVVEQNILADVTDEELAQFINHLQQTQAARIVFQQEEQAEPAPPDDMGTKH
jgi:hypothetical protein